jgi:hypothetical protein
MTPEHAAAKAEAEFLGDAWNELARAREQHPDEEGVLTDAEWLAVLSEEVGECAKAIQDETDAHLRAELVQVAAMAMRWALSIPAGRVRPPWAPQRFRTFEPPAPERCTRDGATCKRQPCCRRPGESLL